MPSRKLPVAALLCLLTFLASACSSIPRRDPTGEMFPTVRGTSLDDIDYELPEHFRGEPVLLLVGYRQNTQFDLDRWLLGLLQAEVEVATFEVPTIPGLTARLASGYIDNGMRSGIPSEDWGSVITVYADANAIVNLTGNENPRNGRILLLDKEGRVVWFWDQGYSARRVLDLKRAVAAHAGLAPTSRL
ncbi:MAG: hypothetical protein VYE77_01090 [Planctomycetota bacterium]|nr:hypothetical protein [Planctomycetota bacterium]